MDRPPSGEHVGEMRVDQKGSHLVPHGGGDLPLHRRREPFVLPEPEGPHVRVRDPPYRPLPELGIVEEPEDVAHGSLWLVKEGEEGMSEEVLQARPPGVPPELLHDIDEPRGGQGALGRRDARDGVIPHLG
jgi:hypothetical protein